ncbi:MAG: DNA recombination protein RmuC [Planctomycetes bacterium]|nr:DNA recombination protein RmuC [Planctomycetota bacterium]
MEYLIISTVSLILGLAVGGAVGWALTHFISKARMAQLEAQHESDAEKIAWTEGSERRLREAFELLAGRSLKENAAHFSQTSQEQLTAHANQIGVMKVSLETTIRQLELHNRQQAEDFSGKINLQLATHAQAIGVVKLALETSIKQLETNVRELEVKREGAYQSLTQNVLNLEQAHKELRITTEQLVNALKSGPVRGRWGEIQLRKIVELSGMSEHVSFVEQVSGELGIPDMLIRLPNQGHIAVDSKFTAQAFLEAMASTDEASRKEKLQEHAKDLKRTVNELSKRNYWKEFDQPSPELVIMFVPIESCLMAAFQCDPDILEFALEQKVILASPVTLLGYMKSIHFGWQQFVIRKNAKLIVKQARALHDKTEIWMRYFGETGKKIQGVVGSYDKCVTSLQKNFLPACRKLEGMSGIAEELGEPDMLAISVRLPPATPESLFDDAGEVAVRTETDVVVVEEAAELPKQLESDPVTQE